ncbi:MAG: hypothetical protein ACI8T1_005229 [Verrucomicrobiales bacterium]|jgi:hypothetical protein
MRTLVLFSGEIIDFENVLGVSRSSVKLIVDRMGWGLEAMIIR